MKTRTLLPTLIKPRDRYPVGLELGVATGDFTVAVLDLYPTLRMSGVDRWSDHHDEMEYRRTVHRLGKYKERSFILRMTFEQALHHFSDESLDWIYIDGYAHTGQEGGKTLKDWFPKLRRGGIFSGHDYHPDFQPTMDAVDSFAQSLNTHISLTTQDQYPSWWLVK
jgi:hypothetical protein